MIESIFYFLVIVAALLIIIGFWTEQPYLSMIGYTFLFIAAVTIMTSGIDFTIGHNITQNGNNTLVYNITETYQNARLGMYLAFVCVGAFIVTIWNWRSFNK
jgi:hypothetical protein